MKWIKASERLPEKAGRYFARAHMYYYDKIVNVCLQWDKFWHIQKKDNVIEWLDETPTTTVAPPVSEEGGIESLIKKYERYISNLQWHLDTNRPELKQECSSRINDFREMVSDLKKLAGANSVRQQGDVLRVWNMAITIANNECMILSDEYNDDDYTEKADAALECSKRVRGHLDHPHPELKSQSPSMPQPGFIEKLRASNPYANFKDHKYPDDSSCYNDIWNECCDKASEILGGKGEECWDEVQQRALESDMEDDVAKTIFINWLKCNYTITKK